MLGSFLTLDEDLSPVLLPTLRGQLRTILQCADCETERASAEGDPFGCLVLPLCTAADGQEIRSVEAALAEYRRAEPMAANYLWHCPNPACHAAGALKRMDFQSLPNVLWFQLQRWRMEAPGRPVRNLFTQIASRCGPGSPWPTRGRRRTFCILYISDAAENREV